MIDCEFDTLILSLVLIWIFYVFSFNLQLSNFKFLIDKDYKFIVDYGSIWLFFFFFTMLTGFCQKRESIYFKRSFIAIFSVLFGMLVFAYAFRPILF